MLFQSYFENHAPLITTLKKGTIKVESKESGTLTFEVEGGVVEVLKKQSDYPGGIKTTG